MTALPMSAKCIKYLLFIFNLLFVITGIIILSVGATVHGIYGKYSPLIDGGYMSTSAFLVAIGFIIFFISFFGCCGAVKENACMIITFSCLLILIFIFELAGGISGYVLRNNTEDLIKGTLNHTMQKYLNSTEDARVFDLLQEGFECCGIENYTDWYSIFDNNSLPVSCCPRAYGTIDIAICNRTLNNVYNTSCIDAFGDFVADHSLTLGGVGLGLAFVQLIGIVFACHLAKQIKNSYNNM